MNVLSRVKSAAATRGLSVEKLSEEVTKRGTKVSKSTIYKWDKSEPNAEKIRAVADVLGVSVDYLLGNTDEMYPSSPSGTSGKKQPVDLDEVLSDEGMAMFDGQPLSEEYKKALLAMLRANRNGEH